MRVALLTNFVPPYRIPVFRALRDRVSALRIFVSTAMEENRQWTPDWSDLDVVAQKTWSRTRRWEHERFTETYQMHVPYDTSVQLRRFKPDVIISAEFGMRTLQSLLYGAAADVPVIVWATLTEHLERSRGRLRRIARRAMVRSIERVIVNGESGARYIRGLGFADNKIARIPQAIDLAPFTALPLERSNPRSLLFVGNVSELKGAPMLIEALSGMAQPVEITMAGEGPLRERLQNHPLPPNVKIEWLGAVPYEQLPAIYGKAGLLIFPTQGDEWGLVVNEAMASGVPVIGSEYSQAVDELVRDGVNGWRFRPDSIDHVSSAIKRALCTPEGIMSAIRQAARVTASAITPSNTADKIVRLAEAVR